jgi:hypothetical protein
MLLDQEEIRLLMRTLFYVGGDWEHRDNFKVVSPAYPEVVAPDALPKIKEILNGIGINTDDYDHLVYLANSREKWKQRLVIDCSKLKNALQDNNINIINLITEMKDKYIEAKQNGGVSLSPGSSFISLINNCDEALEMLNQKPIENTLHP